MKWLHPCLKLFSTGALAKCLVLMVDLKSLVVVYRTANLLGYTIENSKIEMNQEIKMN